MTTLEDSEAPLRRARPTRARKAAVAVSRSIVDEITDRKYAPGTKLPPERDMIGQYDVGRGTLREALRFLELTGVLVMRAGPGGGPIVAAPEAEDLAGLLGMYLQLNQTSFGSLIQAREVLEPAMASMAASNATAETLEVLLSSVHNMERFIEDEENFSLEEANFHQCLATASGNTFFALLIASLHFLTDDVPGLNYPVKRRKVMVGEHRAIYEAVAAGDGATAADLMAKHIVGARRFVEKTFPTIQERLVRWSDTQ
jgi:GntR family transcriptional regulator, transcriptional repressor for pyruvate dehydrogenase complex